MVSQLENLERLRQELETNIVKLKKLLQYWQTWEVEYEGLKEELERWKEEPNVEQMLQIALEQASELISEREIKQLLNYDKQPTRNRSQVIIQIRGRIDTGEKNSASVRKQLAAAEEKLDKVFAVTEDTQDVVGIEGDEQMDIFEELDDNDNVISSRVVNASKDKDKLREVLKSNGLAEDDSEQQIGLFPCGPAQQQTSPMPTAQPIEQSKKVTFAHENRDTHRAPLPDRMHPTQRMLVVDHNDNVIDSRPLELVHPQKAPPEEDAETMIEHMREARGNAREIAPIVASFDIESDTDSDVNIDMDEVHSEWDENEYGMNDIGTQITDDYKAQMEALMQKHAVAMENAGPTFNPDVVRKLETAHRDTGFITRANEHEPDQTSDGASTSKGVRFADKLDISPAPANSEAPLTNFTKETHAQRFRNPVAEAVLERSTEPKVVDSRTTTKRKPSRFKTTMNTASNKVFEADESSPPLHTTPTPIQIDMQRGNPLLERSKKTSRFKAAKLEP